METLVEEVLRSPRAKLYLDEIEKVLCCENAARQRFRDEFRDGEKAEFINGKVIVHSPAKLEHLSIVRRTMQLLSTFAQVHGLGRVESEKALITLTRNDYEPDVCFWRSETASQFQPKQMLFPAPDLVVEVLSPSTEERDRGVKFEDYAAHGTAEYWLIDPDARTIEQYILRDKNYVLAQKSSDGHLRSSALEGFAVPVIALFEDGENLKALRHILSSD